MPTLLPTMLHTLLPSLVQRHLRVCRQPISHDHLTECPQSRGVVCGNQSSIVCRRSSRQSIARLIRLRSKLTRRPAPGACLYDSAHGELIVADCEMAEVTTTYNFLGWTSSRSIQKRNCDERGDLRLFFMLVMAMNSTNFIEGRCMNAAHNPKIFGPDCPHQYFLLSRATNLITVTCQYPASFHGYSRQVVISISERRPDKDTEEVN